MSDNDDEIVYIASWRTGTNVYHEDQDCGRFKTPDGGTPKERSKLPEDREPCSYCCDERTRGVGRTGSGYVYPYCGEEQSHLAVHLRNSECGRDE